MEYEGPAAAGMGGDMKPHECGVCGEIFASQDDYDEHKVNCWDYQHWPCGGGVQSPKRKNLDEIEAKGWFIPRPKSSL